MLRYVARKRRDEAILIRRIHELAIRHGRYGCRRIAVLLGREGWKVNKKRVHRIWKSEGLGLPRRRPKRRRMGPADEIVNKAESPNHESFIDKLRDECLNREVFHNGKEARAIVENWRQEYNNYRPHSSLDYLTPAEFARQYYEKNQAEGTRQLTEMAGTLSL